jgi:hypothetical protein
VAVIERLERLRVSAIRLLNQLVVCYHAGLRASLYGRV